MKAIANTIAVGPGVKLLKLGLKKKTDHPAGASSAYHLHLTRGESPAAEERRGHYRTPQERRQDGVRKLPRHLARVTRG